MLAGHRARSIGHDVCADCFVWATMTRVQAVVVMAVELIAIRLSSYICDAAFLVDT